MKSQPLAYWFLRLILVSTFCLVSGADGFLSAEMPLTKQQLEDLRDSAYSHQQQDQWCEARQVWQKLLTATKEVADGAAMRSEAERNLHLLKRLCEPAQEPVDLIITNTQDRPLAERPEKIPQKYFLQYYPVGKQVRSLSLLNISGSGVNKGWGLEGEVYFTCQHRVALDLKVLQNNGSRLEVELYFAEVSQVGSISGEQLQLQLPEGPLLPLLAPFWDHADKLIVRRYPKFIVVKWAAIAAAHADPRAKRTLTFLA